jgi:GT2 family glycosyltransferase
MINSSVGIVLVEFNQRELTHACINSIFSGSFRNTKIIVIDNSTRPQSPGFTDDSIYYKKLPENMGFCAACNLGVQIAHELKLKYTLILNYDTILKKDCMEVLISRISHLPEPAIISGKICYDSDRSKMWYAGGRLSLIQGVGKHFGKDEYDDGSFNQFREVTYLSGCCMLAATDTFHRLGPFKSEIFMYLDDAEFCLRARHCGARLYYEPEAILYHSLGAGDERNNYSPHYLYFSIRNKPRITSNPPYRLYLQSIACILAVAKIFYYGLNPKTSGKRKR